MNRLPYNAYAVFSVFGLLALGCSIEKVSNGDELDPASVDDDEMVEDARTTRRSSNPTRDAAGTTLRDEGALLDAGRTPRPDAAAAKADASIEQVCKAGGEPSSPDASTPIDQSIVVTGPVTGGQGKPFTATAADLEDAGYSENEYLYEGQAVSYTLQGGMSQDGKWQLREAAKAAFKSRLLVRRPLDPCKFNGTVVVEWLNVSGGADGDPGFMYVSQEILREGYAWVGVSAQAVGVEGGGFSLGGAGAVPLKQADPERYGSLKHPGDAYSFDIYTQAAKIVRGAGGLDVLEGLKPQRLLAYGESQSASRLVSYVNGVEPLQKQYDGYFIHSRSGAGASFGGSLGLPGAGGGSVRIRDDLEAKVFQFQTETDVTGMGYVAARQPDSDRIRSWEVAGTAHADQYILDFNKSLGGGSSVMCEDANDGPQHFVIKAALHSLDAWLRDGTEPPRGEVLMTDARGALAKDEHGNARGGIRSPDVDVPIATLSGEAAGTGGDLFCFLFGSTTPFTPEKLMSLYPTHEDYVEKVRASAQKAREGGFLLPPEEQAMVDEADAAAIPK